MARSRNDQGQYSDGIPPEAVLEVFDEREDRARPVTANDITEELGIARRTAHNKLNRLVERGELETRKIGARGRVWWTPIPREDVDATATRAATQRREETPEATPGETDTSPEEPRETPRDAPRAGEDPIEELDLPGSGANLEGRREAVKAIYEYLKEHGSGQRSDFKDVVDAEATGYGGETPFASFWNNCMDSGAVLAELPGVRSPGEGGHRYTYADPGGDHA